MRTHFAGTFSKGKMVSGVLKFADNSFFVGEFDKNHRFHGMGRLTYSRPEVFFQGGFVNGLKHGVGEEHFEDGSFYVGSYLKGQRHGLGRLFYRAKIGKQSYTGEWQQN